MIRTAIGVTLLTGMCLAAQAQTNVAAPEGWSALKDGDVLSMRPPDGSDVLLSLLNLKDAQTDLGVWIKLQAPKIRVEQSEQIMVLDGRPMQITLAEDPDSGKLLLAIARPDGGGLKVALLAAGSASLAAGNLDTVLRTASQWQTWPQPISQGTGNDPAPAVKPPAASNQLVQKATHRHLVYDPGTERFRLLDTTTEGSGLSGAYAYVSDLFASPVGASVLAPSGKAMILFEGNQFALAGTPAGTFGREGSKLTLNYPKDHTERFRMAVLDSANGLVTKFAIGPCVFVRTNLAN